MDDNKRRQFRACFRQNMNADLSNSMRAHGLNYKLNFGVPAPRIKLIAEQFEKNAQDATELWQEDVRESKMLATYLYPIEQMTEEIANEWAAQIQFPEIADQACMNLFSKTSFAWNLGKTWILSSSTMLHYTGLRLMVRLLMQQNYPEKEVFASFIFRLPELLLDPTLYVQQVAVTLSEKIMEADTEYKIMFQKEIESWREEKDSLKHSLYTYFIEQ